MVRRQVQFTAEELAGVQALARETSSSFAAVVRDAVDSYLARRAHDVSRPSSAGRIDFIAGKYRSGRHDISRRHDDYFADSVAD